MGAASGARNCGTQHTQWDTDGVQDAKLHTQLGADLEAFYSTALAPIDTMTLCTTPVLTPAPGRTAARQHGGAAYY